MRLSSIYVLFSLLVGLLLSPSVSWATKLTHEPLIDINYRPDASTDEGGFWYQVEKLEQQAKVSPYRINDPELNSYLSGIICKLTPDYCNNIRVYVIDNPHFNASMYPNGMMHIWSGVFLRVENEAQLASILGHEIGHYLQTHQIQQFRQYKESQAISMVLDIAIGSVTGVNGIGTLLNSTIFAGFNRDQERQADTIGLELMGYAGYDTDEASKVWSLVLEEREADKSTRERSIFWSTHPASEERRQTLKEKSVTFKQSSTVMAKKGEQPFRKQVARIFKRTMSNHLSLQEYEQTETILQRLQKTGFEPSLVDYFYGELFRLRAQEGDIERAIAAYSNSALTKDCPNEAYKQLGYLYLKTKDNDLAKQNFAQYLKLESNAEDKALINYYMEMLK